MLKREESAAATLVDLGGDIRMTPGEGFTARLMGCEATHRDCEEAAVQVLEAIQCSDPEESRQRDRETIRNFRHFMWAVSGRPVPASETAPGRSATSAITAALLAALAGAGQTPGCGCPACDKKRKAKGEPGGESDDKRISEALLRLRERAEAAERRAPEAPQGAPPSPSPPEVPQAEASPAPANGDFGDIEF